MSKASPGVYIGMKCRVEASLVSQLVLSGMKVGVSAQASTGEGAVKSSYDVLCLHFSQPRAVTLLSLSPCLARVWR